MTGYDTLGFGRKDDAGVSWFIEWVNETQSFRHLSNEVIKGWLLGRLELRMFGGRRRAHWEYDRRVCYKCKGKGWFGHGRPDCPKCVAMGLEPIVHTHTWVDPRRFDCYDKRKLHASMYELGFIKRRSAWFWRFQNMATHQTPIYPVWVNDISISGDYSNKERDELLSEIKSKCITHYNWTPKVEGERLMICDIFEQRIKMDETTIRLALTFGCTCPVTGEYIPPIAMADRFSNTSDYLDDDTSHILPLGFSAHKMIWLDHKERHIWLRPFSDKGIAIIKSAIKKCMKALDGEIDSEWVLAEVMQSALLKRAA